VPLLDHLPVRVAVLRLVQDVSEGHARVVVPERDAPQRDTARTHGQAGVRELDVPRGVVRPGRILRGGRAPAMAVLMTTASLMTGSSSKLSACTVHHQGTGRSHFPYLRESGVQERVPLLWPVI
jgi:hypothetical protein